MAGTRKQDPTDPPVEETPSGELVVVDPETGEVTETDPQVRRMDLGLAQYLGDEKAYQGDTPESRYRMIIDQILSSETLDDVLTPVEAMSARDMIGTPFIVNGWQPNESEYDVGCPFYATMHCTLLETGEKVVINSGNQAMIAQLLWMDMHNKFPQNVTVYEGRKPNQYGNKPLRLTYAKAATAPPEQPGF